MAQKIQRKVLSVLLSVALIVSYFPIISLAAGGPTPPTSIEIKTYTTVFDDDAGGYVKVDELNDLSTLTSNQRFIASVQINNIEFLKTVDFNLSYTTGVLTAQTFTPHPNLTNAGSGHNSTTGVYNLSAAYLGAGNVLGGEELIVLDVLFRKTGTGNFSIGFSKLGSDKDGTNNIDDFLLVSESVDYYDLSSVPIGVARNFVVTPISDLTGTSGNAQATLNFSAPTGATSVKVQQKVGGGSFTDSTHAALTAASTSAVVTGLTNDTAYTFRVMVIGGDHEGNSNEITITPVQPDTISSVVAIDAINVSNGTAIGDVALPSSVTVNLTAGGTISANVNWNTDPYISDKSGNYVLTGTLSGLPDHISNPDSVTASITVTVGASSNANVSEITLSTGTLSPAFSASETEYTVTLPNGTLVAPVVSAIKSQIDASISIGQATTVAAHDASPGGTDTATILVTAENGTQKTYTITFKEAPPVQATSITITPATSTITDDDGTLDLDATVVPSDALQTVTWSVTNGTGKATIDETTGVLTALVNGTVTVTATSVATGSVTATRVITITGQVNPITSIDAPTAITNITNGTVVGSIGLPTTVTVNVTNVGTATANVTWDTSSYDGLTSGDYTFTGTLTGLTDLSNPDTLSTSITVTVNQSTNANLSGITLSAGSLTFAENTTEYNVILPNGASESAAPTVTATKAHHAASVSTTQATTVAAHTASPDGADTATILVTAQNGTQKTYTITFKEAPPVQATSITITPATSTITDDDGTLDLDATVVPSDALQTVTWSVANGTGKATIDETTGVLTALVNGTVTVTATSVATGSVTATKVITITGQVNPITSIVAPTAITNIANGTVVGSIGLPTTVTVNATNVGTATANVTWDTSSYDGLTSGDYTFTGALTGLTDLSNPDTLTTSITVTVNQSSNANLSGITLTAGSLTFAENTTEYNVTLPYGASENAAPTVTATKAHHAASVSTTQATTVAAHTASPGGADTATIVVTAQDGTVKTYTITFKEAPPTPATSITLAASPTAITVDGGNTTVTATVSPGGGSGAPQAVTWSIVSGGDLVQLEYSDSTNYMMNAIGNGTVVLRATHQYTTAITRDITINITGQVSAGLTDLEVSDNDLNVTFDQSQLVYSTVDTVTTTVYSLTVTPTASAGTIKVNGVVVTSGSASNPIDLKPGYNKIKIEVTEQNKLPKVYTINVYKQYPYSIGSVSTDLVDSVLTASVDIYKHSSWSAGEVVVIFQLMDGDTPVGYVAKEANLGEDQTFTAEFTELKGNGYTVKVLVWDTLDSSKTHIGTNLADPRSDL